MEFGSKPVAVDIFDASLYDIKVEKYDVIGNIWRRTRWTIQMKEQEHPLPDGDITRDEVILNQLRVAIATTKYKHTVVTSIETDCERNKCLNSQHKYNLCLPVSQEDFDIGDRVTLSFTNKGATTLITVITTHDMLQGKHLTTIPFVAVGDITPEKSLKIILEVKAEREGPYDRCFVNFQNQLIVENDGYFDISKLFHGRG